ncbi:hypothetical protein, partial [Vibrio cholerae]|uniref:hypothetical protein n=1 Tax=Vibrio cholerae TaxID=666 RepID=UPI001F3D262A
HGDQCNNSPSCRISNCMKYIPLHNHASYYATKQLQMQEQISMAFFSGFLRKDEDKCCDQDYQNCGCRETA